MYTEEPNALLSYPDLLIDDYVLRRGSLHGQQIDSIPPGREVLNELSRWGGELLGAIPQGSRVLNDLYRRGEILTSSPAAEENSYRDSNELSHRDY